MGAYNGVMLTARPVKTFDDLMALPPETRAELIEGEIIMSPAPESRHQDVVLRIAMALSAHVTRHRCGRIFVAPLDIILSRRAVVQPDVLFVSSDRSHIIRKQIEGAPDLAVEVLSPGTEVEDRLVKRRLYGKYGVREYWIADPEARTIEVLVRETAGWRLYGIFTEADDLTSPLLTDLHLSVRDIFS